MQHRRPPSILAAGQGTRMKSALPKVLHAVCGRPIVHYGVQAALDAGCAEVVVVVGHGREHGGASTWRGRSGATGVKTAVQEQQRGTGDAARAGLAAVGRRRRRGSSSSTATCRSCAGDDLRGGVRASSTADEARPWSLRDVHACDDPSGYGRILRKDGQGRRSSASTGPERRRGARRARDQRGHLRGERGVPARGARARSRRTTRRASSTSPTSWPSRATQGERVATVQLGRGRARGGQRPPPARRRSTGRCSARIVRRWRVAGVTVRDGRAHRGAASSSSRTRPSRRAWSCAARRACGAARRSTSAACSRTWTSARGRRQAVHGRRPTRAIGRAGADRAVLAPAPGQRHRRGGARRQLRRDEEDAHGQGREGQPPRVPRRRRHRRRRERRRGHHLLQLRRLPEAHDDHRRGRLHRQRLAARRAGHHRRRRLRRDRHHGRPATSRRTRSRSAAREAGEQRGVRAEAQGTLEGREASKK